ncbi:MAG: adenylate/guanylate cyclase domain-containing protein [Bacteroidetes bacterium]|nr:MAG: adenylate/guanylate cyclase domain-containing protein [Bacteroidota bacterium]TAG89175.1 MAG: adenylate/guanylate cyclase domain-containing protein [Bacteroidota bacterium]
MIIKAWENLSHLGIKKSRTIYEYKSIIILNQLALLGILLTLSMASFLYFNFNFIEVPIALLCNCCLFIVVLFLNKNYYTDLSKILVSTIPALSLLTASMYAKTQGITDTLIFYIAPRTGLMMVMMIPLFLFGFSGWKKMLLGMSFSLIAFLFYDFWHSLIGIYPQKLPYNPNEYPAFIFGTTLQIIFIITTVYLVQNINNEYELKVQQQKKEIERLLLNILPEEVAEELKQKGTATPQHYPLVSVLFTDFKGFTNIAEKLTPQEVIEELNHCFLEFDKIVEKYNLEKIKTIGDAYMCAGGIPVANTTNPVDITKAGLEMQQFMKQLKQEKIQKNQPVWELRLGIHTGEVIAGVIGKNKFAYDIWGDTVNLAARMESSGEVGKVNISEKTYELIKDKFQCTFRGKIEAKNKGEVEMYFVENALP